MQRSKEYVISPANISDLSAAVLANGGASRGVAIHTVNSDHYGDYLIRVVGVTDSHYFDDVCKMAACAERGRAVLLPVRNKNSRHCFLKGENAEFKAELYHIGVWTNPQYGVQYIHRFITLDNAKYEITWTTGKLQPLGLYKVSCKIKDHTNYGDVDQTAVSHCKLEPLEG